MYIDVGHGFAFWCAFVIPEPFKDRESVLLFYHFNPHARMRSRGQIIGLGVTIYIYLFIYYISYALLYIFPYT